MAAPLGLGIDPFKLVPAGAAAPAKVAVLVAAVVWAVPSGGGSSPAWD